VIWINRGDKATLGVDEIRRLHEDVFLPPTESAYKFYCIEDADTMTVQAQNAFLLTLEEPPAYVRFFLLCENADRMLTTIRSRAPLLRTEAIPAEDIRTYLLKNDPAAVRLEASAPDELTALLRLSGDGIGGAKRLLETRARKVALERYAAIREFVSAVLDHSSAYEVLDAATVLTEKRDTFLEALQLVQLALRDLLLLKKSDRVTLLFYTDPEEALNLSDRYSKSTLYRFWCAVRNAAEAAERNANLSLIRMRMLTEAGAIRV
jgi:DNA polymerase-3 subunit delta'